MLHDEPRFWTFLKDAPGAIPLTNNTAERAIRPYVIRRKTRFFSQSPSKGPIPTDDLIHVGNLQAPNNQRL
ncbi:IS66 family transposase [Methylomarinum roseum]|uniref:IS66 family transposase n=1 Tax=Methylomarinum roseum TaxID=3067653 RepID=UPI003D7ED9E6